MDGSDTRSARPAPDEEHPPMKRRARGFTLVELTIVIAIIAIIAAIAIPNLIAARLSANETAAIATLRNVASAQAQFQQSAKADTDNDGTGEYGGFIELSGFGAGRMASTLVPSVLSGAFRVLNDQGEVSRSGYFFRIYLPSPTGAGVPEPQAGYADDGSLDGDHTETTWCCYAWPVDYSQSGSRTFFTSQAGDVIGTEDSSYSGKGAGPAHDAAFATANFITGKTAIGVAGPAGNIWTQVQ